MPFKHISFKFIFVALASQSYKQNSCSFFVDLCLMSLCKHHIIANSSFSWWGAWLSGSDNVIAPMQWFGEGNQDKDTKDLIPERWTRI
jgi:hypothetical protein